MASRRGRPSASRLFIGAVMVAAAGGAAAIAAGVPAFSGDEAAHVDYAFQLWHGQLPVFEDGLLLPTDVGTRPSRQWVSQHPPLYYLLLAPVVGPLGDAHLPVAAAMAARLVTMLITVATALAAVWTVKQVLPRSCAGARFAAPIVMVCSPWFMRLGGQVYNDMLLILLVTLLFGLTAKLIRQRESRLDFLWLTLVLAAGALTRLSFVPVALACLGGLAVTQLMRDRRDHRAWVRTIVIPSGGALAASAWFYLLNVERTGSVAGSQAEWGVANMGRVQRSFGDALGSSAFWRPSLQQFALSPEIGDRANDLLFVVPAAIGLLLATAFVVLRMLARGRRAFPADALLLGLVVVVLVGVFAQQALYFGAGGGAKGRYLAMLLLLFSLAIAVALTSVKALGPWLLGGWLVIHTVELFLDLRALLARELNGPTAEVYPAAAWAGFGVHVVALAVALASYIVWSGRRRTQPSDAQTVGLPRAR